MFQLLLTLQSCIDFMGFIMTDVMKKYDLNHIIINDISFNNE